MALAAYNSPNRQRVEAVAAHEQVCDQIQTAAEAGESTFHYSHNYILRAFPEDIKLLKPTLQVLHIDNNFQLSSLPSSIGDLTGLRWLNVSYNELTELPSEISKLRNLERLHVNNNRLKSLPIEMWALKSLQELHADCNELKALPTGVFFLRELREVFLNNNPLIVDSDAEGAEVSELFPPMRYGDCGNCNVRFSKSIAMCSFHSFCNNADVPFCHYVCSTRCEEQLRYRLQHAEDGNTCRLIVSGSGDTYVLSDGSVTVETKGKDSAPQSTSKVEEVPATDSEEVAATA